MSGDFQFIDALKALALFELHNTTYTFYLNNINSRYIVDLTRYTSSKGERGKRDYNEEIEELGYLVCQFIAFHTIELSSNPHFVNLFAEKDQVIKDSFRFQSQRSH